MAAVVRKSPLTKKYFIEGSKTKIKIELNVNIEWPTINTVGYVMFLMDPNAKCPRPIHTTFTSAKSYIPKPEDRQCAESPVGRWGHAHT